MHDTLLFVGISMVGVTTIFGLILIIDAIVAKSKEEKKKVIDLNN
jgi:hypothetical protein